MQSLNTVMLDNTCDNEVPDQQLKILLDMVSDESACDAFRRKYSNPIHHSKAILRAVYEDKRKIQQDRFADLVYLESFDANQLLRKPFINFGPGEFRHKYWRTADKVYEHNDGKLWSESRGKNYKEQIDHVWDMYKQMPIEIEDDSMEVAYASHIIEHAYDDDNDFFFRDVYRILRKNGVFRLTAPNIDLGLRAAKDKDYSYYGYSQYLRGSKYQERVLGNRETRYPIEYFVVENCSLLVREENSTFLSPKDCVDFLWSGNDVYKTLDKASALSDRSLNEKIAAHVNWFNPNKIYNKLKQSGFDEVRLSAHGQSVCPVLRDVRYFDNTNPKVSWYIDAVK